MSENYQFPEDFKEFIEELDLPSPPIALELINSFEQRELNAFASDDRAVHVPNRTMQLVDIEEYITNNKAYANGKDIADMHFCACGLGGHGIQNTFFYYIEEQSNFLAIVRMPWARVYSDSEEDKKNLITALKIVRLAQVSELKDYRLEFIIDNSSCEWVLYKNENKEEIERSSSFKELVDLIKSDEIVVIKGHEYANWMPV